MCGRTVSTTSPEQIAALVSARGPFPPWRPRYNQPPGETVANVIESNGVRRIEPFVWGIRGRDPKRPFINVRGESVPKSRDFAGRRSLVFVDGFYEWDRKKNPYYIRRRDHKPFALGAVYDESPEHRRFAIITTQPNQTVARVHNRMPAILPPEAWKVWLDPMYPDHRELAQLLRPSPDDPLLMHPVSTLVNNPRNDRPELIQPDDTVLVVERQKQVRELLARGREMRDTELAEAIKIPYDDLLELIRDMPGVEWKRGVCWLTRWNR